MRLKSLELSHFRLYEQMRLVTQSGLTLLTGPNAQGKTAFLEAIYVLASARSFRAQSEAELVRWGSQDCLIKAELERDSGRRRTLELRWNKQGRSVKKAAFLQGRPIQKLAEFLGELPVALFTPEDLALVQAGPALRRRYLNLLLCKLYPAYLSTLSNYQKALANRNQLLRLGQSEQLHPWDTILSELGLSLVDRRTQLCHQLAPCLSQFYRTLSGEKGELVAEYRPGCPPSKDDFLARLKAARTPELRQKRTLVGPHRDDLAFQLDGKELRRYGSQGQQRTAALSLRLAEARMLTELGQEKAIILLDDCFSELDPGRQERLLTELADYPQVFVTSATPLDLPAATTILQVSQGTILPEPEETLHEETGRPTTPDIEGP